MLIKEANLFHVRMPLLEPWVKAYRSQNDIESLLVNLKCEEADVWASARRHRCSSITLSTQKEPLRLRVMF
jgi:hypothetical protein